MATNTIDGVNLAAVAEESLPALQSAFAPLSGIATDFSLDIHDEGESVTTRYPTKPTAVDLSSGYTAQNTAMTKVTTTLDTFYGFVWGFNDVERSKSSLMLNDLFLDPAIQAVGDKMFADLWNLVTVANFPTETVISAANFNRNDLADLGATLTQTLKAPKFGRFGLLSCGHYASIVKSLNSAEVPGITADKAEAIAPRTAKFDLYESDSADDNSEGLAGFVGQRSALLLAARRVDSGKAAQAGVEVEDIEVPGLGLPLQLRRWYDPDAGLLKYSLGVLYGVKKGTAFGIRIKTT